MLKAHKLFTQIAFIFAATDLVYSLCSVNRPQDIKSFAKSVAIISASFSLWGDTWLCNSAAAADDGAKLFEQSCAACHIGGGNVIGYARNKTLKIEALNKSGYNTEERIVELLKNGAGAMPRYSEYTKKNGDVVPAKLTDKELIEVSNYVLLRASQSWK